MVEQFSSSKTQRTEHLTIEYLTSFYELMMREIPCMLKTICGADIALGWTHTHKTLDLICKKNLKFEKIESHMYN